MRKLMSYKIYGCILILSLVGLTGCSKDSDKLIDNRQADMPLSEETEQIEQTEGSSADDILQIEETPTDEIQEVIVEPMIEDMDWSNYFEGINGAAVIYEPAENCYQIYNQELALTRRSPCSTFKIISSLIALENGIIQPNESKSL